MMTIRELRKLIADNCDPTQPLRVVAHDVGKKADKHSIVCVDENHPINLKIAPGTYDERASIEFAYYPESKVLTPQILLDALDELLEERPQALFKWAYFFYFPMEYVGMFKRVKRIDNCLLDTSKIQRVYMSEDYPNTLVIEGEYEFGSFD